MLGKFFRKNKTVSPPEEDDLPSGPADPMRDAEAIHASVDYTILRAAWDEYVTLKKQDPDYQYGDATPTPCWKALEKVREYHGDFTRFTKEEQHLLRALRKGFMIYDDVLHVLIDHHSDTEAAADLYAKYPQLHGSIPAAYDNPEHVIEVLIELARDYQWQLERFSMEHGVAIDAAIDPSRAAEIHHRAAALPDAHGGSYDGEESYLSDTELGIAPPTPPASPFAEKLAGAVIDRMEAMEASLAVDKPRKPQQNSVLDLEELEKLK